MLSPLALMLTAGKFANWINVDVTYAINGFLPMNMVSLASVDMQNLVFKDNLKLKRIFVNQLKKNEKFELILTRKDDFIHNWKKLPKF